MISKYPGDFILNEIGTRKELAGVYGVSERTIYRWLNKAAKESDLIRPSGKKRPAPSVLKRFKGTRKQLAQKYDVSERTIYRWLKGTAGKMGAGSNIMNNAAAPDTLSKTVGAQQKTRSSRAKKKRKKRVPYPGEDILNQSGTLKELAEKYGVSVSTVSRWKRRARLDIFERGIEGAYDPEVMAGEEPPELIEEPIFEEPIEAPDIGEPWEVPDVDEDDIFEVTDELDSDFKDLKIMPETIDDLVMLSDLITDLGFVNDNSMFNDLSRQDKIIYLNKYIEWCYDHDREMFYNKETHTQDDTSPDFVATLPIWGNDFDKWLEEQYESDHYEI